MENCRKNEYTRRTSNDGKTIPLILSQLRFLIFSSCEYSSLKNIYLYAVKTKVCNIHKYKII